MTGLREYLKQNFPHVFHRPWTDEQIRVTDEIERSVTSGFQYTVKMRRGQGATSICQYAVGWLPDGNPQWLIDEGKE